MKKKPYAVIFDMDGVIFDSEKLSMDCWKCVAQKYKIPNIEQNIYSCMGKVKDDAKAIMKQNYGETFDYEKYRAEKNALYKQFYAEKRLQLKKGVIEILTFLKSNNVSIGLATSTASKVVSLELMDYNLYHYFDVLVCGDEVLHGKPNPEVYLKACEKIGYDPKCCYAIEDSVNGVLSAQNACMNIILVPDMIKIEEMNLDMSKVCIKNSLIEVVEMFKDMRKEKEC